MKNKITIFDYDVDWALMEHYNVPKGIPGYLTLEDSIKFFGTLGVDGVELSRRYWEDFPTSHVKKLVDDTGLAIVSYIFYEDMVVPPGGEQRAAIDRTRRQLDRTAELGASLAMIVPAVYKKGIQLEQQRRWLIEGLRRCTEYAESIGLTLAIENIDDPPVRPFASRGTDCRAICEEINSPAFRLIFDPGCSLFMEENPLEVLRTMAPYVIHVHLKNARAIHPKEKVRRDHPTANGKRLIGTVLDGGLVSIPEILSELNDMEYNGYLMIEYLGESDPRIALPYNLEYLRRQMSYIGNDD